jgi:arsenic resistance protein ArsH
VSLKLPNLPNIDGDLFERPSANRLANVGTSTHAPRILLLYGSLRERSFSRLLTFEAERLLNALGAETRIFNPEGLPLPDGHPESHPKVQELRDLAAWSEGMVWTSPERHGAMTGIMTAQNDWIPLAIGSVRPAQGKTLGGHGGFRWLAVLQCGEPIAHSRTLDAHDHDPKSIFGGEGLPGVR